MARWGWLKRREEEEAPPQVAPPKPPPPAPTASADPLGLPDFLARLRIGDRSGLTRADFVYCAERLGIAPLALEAVVRVECGGMAGFAESGLPTIAYEAPTFSKLTGGRYDSSNPDVSYAEPDPRKVAPSQDVRWLQLGKAFILDREAALKATRWGAFQISGLHHATCGFPTAAAFAAHLAASEARQLEAFESFIEAQKLGPVLKARNWREFARVYNGPAEARRYGHRIGYVYKALKKDQRAGVA